MLCVEKTPVIASVVIYSIQALTIQCLEGCEMQDPKEVATLLTLFPYRKVNSAKEC